MQHIKHQTINTEINMISKNSGEKRRNNLHGKEITFFHIKINRSSKFKDFQIPTNMTKKKLSILTQRHA